MDLLRVISHHKARLATPIRTVQKMYNDTDLDSMPFADSMYSRGVSPRRPLMLIEPSYKIHGEDKKKSRDGKPTVRPSPDPKVDSKVGDSRNSETSISDTKGDARTPNPIIKDDPNSPKPSPSGPKGGDTKSRSNTTSSKHEEKSEFDSKAADGNASRSTSSNSAYSSSARGTAKTSGSMTASVKQEGEKMPVAEPLPTRPAVEENIVLGVALDGSKRTLPIEEEMESPSPRADEDDLASVRKGNASSNSEKAKKIDQAPTSPVTNSDNE